MDSFPMHEHLQSKSSCGAAFGPSLHHAMSDYGLSSCFDPRSDFQLLLFQYFSDNLLVLCNRRPYRHLALLCQFLGGVPDLLFNDDPDFLLYGVLCGSPVVIYAGHYRLFAWRHGLSVLSTGSPLSVHFAPPSALVGPGE